MAAVRMDPYCVLQSGKESVKTKRAHGLFQSSLPISHRTKPIFLPQSWRITTFCMAQGAAGAPIGIRQFAWNCSQATRKLLSRHVRIIFPIKKECSIVQHDSCNTPLTCHGILIKHLHVGCVHIRCSTTASSVPTMRWREQWSQYPARIVRGTGRGSSGWPCSLLPEQAKGLCGAAKSSCGSDMQLPRYCRSAMYKFHMQFTRPISSAPCHVCQKDSEEELRTVQGPAAFIEHLHITVCPCRSQKSEDRHGQASSTPQAFLVLVGLHPFPAVTNPCQQLVFPK